MNDRSSRSHTIFRIIIESLEGGIDDSDDTGKAVKVNTSNNFIYIIGPRFHSSWCSDFSLSFILFQRDRCLI